MISINFLQQEREFNYYYVTCFKNNFIFFVFIFFILIEVIKNKYISRFNSKICKEVLYIIKI